MYDSHRVVITAGYAFNQFCTFFGYIAPTLLVVKHYKALNQPYCKF